MRHAVFTSALVGAVFGAAAGGAVYYFIDQKLPNFALPFFPAQKEEYIPQTTQEQKIIEAVKQVSPAVVSIVITKDVPVLEQYFSNPFEEFFGLDYPFQFQIPQIRQKGTEKQEIGGGSGFLVSQDGLLVTNKHVVLDKEADYTVFLNDGTSYPAKVLARDPVQDLAVLKIDGKADFSFAQFGDSDSIQIGQTAIAIGNALGEFRNTVSVGVISGLGRTITASGGNNFTETIEDVIQTDAAINKGNSGGPLLNLAGQVIGINTATVIDAQNIGFAIPANKAVRDIEQVKESGSITYPFLGVRYASVTESLRKEKDLPVEYGVLVSRGPEGEAAVVRESAADKAGIKEGDIILEFNGEKVTSENTLGKLIQKRKPKDVVSLVIQRGNDVLELDVTLGER